MKGQLSEWQTFLRQHWIIALLDYKFALERGDREAAARHEATWADADKRLRETMTPAGYRKFCSTVRDYVRREVRWRENRERRVGIAGGVRV